MKTSGNVQNFVGVHPSHPDDDEKLGMMIFRCSRVCLLEKQAR